MKYSVNDLDTMWRTLYGEARGTPDDCKEHVALAIRNRAMDENRRYGPNITAVCLQRRQFSCWNSFDPNYRVIQAVKESDPVAAKCIAVCKRVLAGDVTDVTQGSTHYCARNLDPFWTKDKNGEIVKLPVFTDAVHKFFNNVS